MLTCWPYSGAKLPSEGLVSPCVPWCVARLPECVFSAGFLGASGRGGLFLVALSAGAFRSHSHGLSEFWAGSLPVRGEVNTLPGCVMEGRFQGPEMREMERGLLNGDCTDDHQFPSILLRPSRLFIFLSLSAAWAAAFSRALCFESRPPVHLPYPSSSPGNSNRPTALGAVRLSSPLSRPAPAPCDPCSVPLKLLGFQNRPRSLSSQDVVHAAFSRFHLLGTQPGPPPPGGLPSHTRAVCSLRSSVMPQASGIVPVFPARRSSCRLGSHIQLQRF